MTEQAYRYNKDTWDAGSARSHCKDHGGSFTAAGGQDSKAEISQAWHEWRDRKAKGCTGCSTAAPKNWYRIEAKTEESTIYIYNDIGGWGISAEEFIKELNAIRSPIVHLRVNSLGGGVFEGKAIETAIKQHTSKTITHIDGVAASIASVIALAANEVRMADGSFFMIHEPWSLAVGTAKTMRQEANLLDKVGDSIAQAYVKKTGKNEEEIKAYMAGPDNDGEGTWFTAEEALDIGFVDNIEETQKEDKKQEKRAAYTPRQIEALLHDQAGLSEKEAKSFVAKGFADFQRDVEGEANSEPKDAGEQRDVACNQRDVDSSQKVIPILGDSFQTVMVQAKLAMQQSTTNGGR